MMEFNKVMLYSGIYNLILGGGHLIFKTKPTAEGLFYGGIANILFALTLIFTM